MRAPPRGYLASLRYFRGATINLGATRGVHRYAGDLLGGICPLVGTRPPPPLRRVAPWRLSLPVAAWGDANRNPKAATVQSGPPRRAGPLTTLNEGMQTGDWRTTHAEQARDQGAGQPKEVPFTVRDALHIREGHTIASRPRRHCSSLRVLSNRTRPPCGCPAAEHLSPYTVSAPCRTNCEDKTYRRRIH